MKILILLILSTTVSLFSEEVIIANFDITNLNKSDIKKIYLGKQILWDKNRKIRLVSYKNGKTAECFSKKFLDKDYSQLVLYWKQLMFTGRGVMPKMVLSQEDMISYIEQTPGAIGYISSSAKTSSNINIIRINDE